MSTIRDVAKRAGVSTMTVSRVINHSGYISPETRERVEKAIAELDYVPNALARGLRFKQTKTIALVLTDITNPFFTTLARGVEDMASEEGFSVIFCNTDESPEAEAKYLNVLMQKQVDGILLVPACSSVDAITSAQSHKVPMVLLDRRIEGAQVDAVRCDSERGAFRLVRHLLSLGHRRIAVLSGPETVSTAVDRVAGYRRALNRARLTPDPQWVCHGAYSEEGGFEMAKRVITSSPRPTALLAANNFIAIGALRAMRQAGLEVPRDMSLVTFDDIPHSFVMEPFMTVAAQPAYEMGKRATKLLFARLAGEGPSGPQEIVLPLELILRQSSSKPRSRARAS